MRSKKHKNCMKISVSYKENKNQLYAWIITSLYRRCYARFSINLYDDVNYLLKKWNKLAISFSFAAVENQVYLCSCCELFFYCLLPFCCCSFSTVVDVFYVVLIFFYLPCAHSTMFPAKCILSSLNFLFFFFISFKLKHFHTKLNIFIFIIIILSLEA